MATIYSRETSTGETQWSAMIRLQGLPTEHKTFPNKTLAKHWAQRREADLRQGRNLLRREAERHTLAELVEVYLEDIAGQGRRRQYLKRQASQLRWWVEQLGNHRLCDVTPAAIAQCKRRLLHTPVAGRDRSPATVNRYLAALSRVLTVAVKELGWLEANPARKVERLPEPRGRMRILSDDEKRRLLEACRSNGNPLLYPAVAVALGTGGRRSEVLGLHWQDVDLREGRESVTFRDTKNSETRSVALAGIALDVIRELHEIPLDDNDSDLVFPARNGTSPASIRAAFDRACEEAEVNDFRFHDLRHTFASYLAMSGATLPEIAEALGHKTLAMVKRYAHFTQQHNRGVVTRMHEEFLGG